jgi:hypothetical protein
MNYNFVKVTSYYRGFLKEYYEQSSEIINPSYDIQLSQLINQFYA